MTSYRKPVVSLVQAFLISLVPALLLLPQVVNGQIRSGAAFLNILPGARQQGIAGIGTGVIDELHAVYANPGVAGFLREWQWAATYSKGIADVYNASLFYGRQIRMPWSKRPRLALGLAYQGMPDFDSSRGATAQASASDLWVSASVGQPFNLFKRSFALGANVKYFESELARYGAHAWMADLGLLYRSARFRFLKSGNGFFDYGIFSAGIAVTQVGQSLTFISTSTPLPQTLRAGIAFNTGTHHGLQLHLAADYRRPRDEKGTFSFGTEISWSQIFALRGGYDFQDHLLSHYAFGISLRLDDHHTPLTNVLPGRNNAVRFDLAAMQDSDLFSRPYRGGVTHQPIGPEKFRLLAPPFGAFVETDTVHLSWEATHDPDLYDTANFWLLVDRDSLKLAQALTMSEGNGNQLFHSLEHSDLLITQKLDQTHSTLHHLAGGNYFWTVLAYDQDRHVRFAGKPEHRIWRFNIAWPDLEITAVDFEYSPWITEDDYHGRLKITVANKGQRPARNVALALYDSIDVQLASQENGVPAEATMEKPIAQTTIPEILPNAIATLEIEWHTSPLGLHHIIARVDEANELAENDETNNWRRAAFYTIPKGRFATEDTAVALVLSRMAYEVPLIAEVCFDRSRSEVRPEYARKWVLEPPLLTIAKRLNDHPNLKITLQGFADPNSDEVDLELAHARAAAVRDTLLSLGVQNKQIKLLPGQVLPRRRPPADSIDARWVYQERRYVQIAADTASEAVLFELVAFDDIEPLPSPVIFTAAVKGVVPLKEGMLQVEAEGSTARVNIDEAMRGATVSGAVRWRHDQSGPQTGKKGWAEKNISYTLVLSDTLGRQFRTPPRQSYLAARSHLREQRVAWPIKFQGTEPLFDFYWTKLLSHVNRMLEDPNMRMRFSGHACAIGPEPVNLRLSQRRAETFHQSFLRNVTEHYPQVYERILQRLDPAVGFGETKPMGIEHLNGDRFIIGDNQNPLGRKLNRRLEIEFYYPTTK